MVGELGPEVREDLLLVRLVLEHFHEVFYAGEAIKHGNTIVHHLLFALTDRLELRKCVLNCHDGRVAIDVHAGV